MIKNKLYIICTLLLIIILGYLIFPLKKTEYWTAPGHTVSIDPFIHASPIDNSVRSIESNLYMTSVKEIMVTSRWNKIMFGLEGYRQNNVNQYSTLVIDNSDFTEKDLNVLNKVGIPYMKHDVINSAMAYSGIDWEEEVSNPIVLFHPEKFRTGLKLQVDDEILLVNQSEVFAPEDIKFILSDTKLGDTVTVTVRRNKTVIDVPLVIEELDRNGLATLGVYLRNRFTFRGLSDDDVIQLDRSYLGDSGGFMLTLGLIQKLNPDVNLSKGRKIAGTGGIYRGGDIREISHLDLKIEAASNEDVDIFFYPKFQEDEALATVKKFNIRNMEVVGVLNLKEAVNYLTNN